MAENTEAAQAAARYRMCCMTVCRKLRFDMQELNASPEIRESASAMERAVLAGEYSEARELSRKIVYLAGMTRNRRLLSDGDFMAIAEQAEALCAAMPE